MIVNFLVNADPMWFWLVGFLVLLVLELLVPGVFMLWLGFAALIIGLLVSLFPVGWVTQVVVFTVLSIGSVYLGHYVSRRQKKTIDTDQSRRFDHYIGIESELVEAIEAGSGRIKVGETTWRVTGPNLAKGSKVKVISADDGVLTVEAVA